MYCTHCGNQLRDQADKYCPSCGQPTANAAASASAGGPQAGDAPGQNSQSRNYQGSQQGYQYDNRQNWERRRLYRSVTDKKIAGVCGGLAEYFDIDPTLIRILAVIALCCGVGFFSYIIAALVIPKEPYPNVETAATWAPPVN